MISDVVPIGRIFPWRCRQTPNRIIQIHVLGNLSFGRLIQICWTILMLVLMFLMVCPVLKYLFMKKTCQNCFFFEMPPSQNKTLQHSICRPMAAVPGRTGQAQNLLAQWFPLTSCPELNGGPALGNGYCRASMTFDNDATLTPFLLDMFFPCVHLLRHVTHLYRNLAWWNGTTHPYQRETPWDLAFCQLTYRAGGGCTMSLLLVNSFRRPIGLGSMFLSGFLQGSICLSRHIDLSAQKSLWQWWSWIVCSMELFMVVMTLSL